MYRRKGNGKGKVKVKMKEMYMKERKKATGALSIPRRRRIVLRRRKE